AKGIKTFFIRFVAFNLASVLGFVIKMSLLLLFERLFGWSVVLCNIVALLISGIINFILAEFVIFKEKPKIIEPVNDQQKLEY
ncbi:MAG: GtrA family protein, partial [Bacteroidales bacterium]